MLPSWRKHNSTLDYTYFGHVFLSCSLEILQKFGRKTLNVICTRNHVVPRPTATFSYQFSPPPLPAARHFSNFPRFPFPSIIFARLSAQTPRPVEESSHFRISDTNVRTQGHRRQVGPKGAGRDCVNEGSADEIHKVRFGGVRRGGGRDEVQRSGVNRKKRRIFCKLLFRKIRVTPVHTIATPTAPPPPAQYSEGRATSIKKNLTAFIELKF